MTNFIRAFVVLFSCLLGVPTYAFDFEGAERKTVGVEVSAIETWALATVEPGDVVARYYKNFVIERELGVDPWLGVITTAQINGLSYLSDLDHLEVGQKLWLAAPENTGPAILARIAIRQKQSPEASGQALLADIGALKEALGLPELVERVDGLEMRTNELRDAQLGVESRLTAVEGTAATQGKAIEEIQSDLQMVAAESQKAVSTLSDRIDAMPVQSGVSTEEVRQLAAEEAAKELAKVTFTPESSFLGRTWQSWIALLLMAVGALGAVALFGFSSQILLWKRVKGLFGWKEEVDSFMAIQIARDLAGRYHAPKDFEKLLNNLKEGESVPLDITPAGQGAAIPKVNVIREIDVKSVPTLKLDGVTPGQNIIHAKKIGGKWCFKPVQLWLLLDKAEKEGLVEGLGKREAVELGVVPGTQRPKPKVVAEEEKPLVFTKPVVEGQATAAARIKAAIAGVRTEEGISVTAGELSVFVHQVDEGWRMKPLASDVPLESAGFDKMLATARNQAGVLSSPPKSASA